MASPEEFYVDNADSIIDEQSTGLLQMPSHVLVKIMRYVNNVHLLARSVAPACRHLHSIVYTPSLVWSTVDLQLSSLAALPSVRLLLSRIGDAVQHLSFYVGNEPVEEFDVCTMDVLCVQLNRLRSLDLGFNRQLSPTIMDYFVDHCPHVVCVNLEGATGVTDEHLRIVRRGWPLLHSIGLSHCTAITDLALQRYFERTANLQTVNVDGIAGLSDTSVVALAVAHAATLRNVYVDGEELTDIAVEALCDNCRHLTLLSVSYAELLTDVSVDALAVSTVCSRVYVSAANRRHT